MNAPDIRTGLDVATSGAAFRLFAECAAATTTFAFHGSPVMPDQADLESWLGQLLVEDHLRRCEVCERRQP